MIYPSVSSSLAENIDDARNDLDMACRMCVVLWTIALIAGCTLASDGAAGAWFAVPVTAAVFGIFSYRAAIRCAEDYGRILYYIFDLHRRDFIRAFGYVPPESPEDERNLIAGITRWLTGKGPAPAGFREKPSGDSTAAQ